MKRREVIKTFIMILRFQIEEQFSGHGLYKNTSSYKGEEISEKSLGYIF